MNEDPRCCGSGTCIIDTEGRCWCGQRWNGQKMCAEALAPALAATAAEARPAGTDASSGADTHGHPPA